MYFQDASGKSLGTFQQSDELSAPEINLIIRLYFLSAAPVLISNRTPFLAANLATITIWFLYERWIFVGGGSALPWGKALPGRDADHSPRSNAEVKNE
jgi:hypothetical protein